MGGRILYFGLIKPVSLLPFFLLYRLSDGLYYILYYIVRYRRKVVRANLTNSFPKKTLGNIVAVEKLFYRHLCDIVVESIKFFSISKKEAHRRFRFTNSEILNPIFDCGKSIVAITSHYNNWELGSICADAFPGYSQTALINRLKNGYLNRKLQSSRKRFGLQLLPKRQLANYLKNDSMVPTALIILGDQSPNNTKKVYWTNFLNQKTAIATGAERISRHNDMPAFYFCINKISRGYYECIIVPVCEIPGDSSENEMTDKYVRLLERQILENPQYWLWSHRRWKTII